MMGRPAPRHGAQNGSRCAGDPPFGNPVIPTKDFACTPDAARPFVEVCGLRRDFDDGNVQALRGLDLMVARGEHIAITGPSGCGKTTLLHLLGALDHPTEGTVTIASTRLDRVGDLSRFRARTIGFVFQSYHLLPTLTAAENVQMPMFEMPWRAPERHRRAAALLDAVGLGHRAHHRPARLSGGERQRVAIARSLANEPQILLADEPTGNLDSESSRQVMALLESIHRERRMTIIVVTHDPVLATCADRTYRMLDGRILDSHQFQAAP
jgi:ABC-type lipoprotein export system ATPase subunit